MNSPKGIIFLLLLFSSTLLFGQPSKSKVVEQKQPYKTCGFDHAHQQQLMNNSQYQKITDDFNKKWAEGDFMLNKSAMAPVYQVPVVVHVLYDGTYDLTDQQVKDGIKYLNNYWRKVAGTYGDGSGVDMEIEFALAVRDESGNCTNGIVRRDMTGNATYEACGVESGTCGITDASAKTGAWDPNEYYNIYLVNFIDGANCFTGGSYTAGYAYFSGAHGASYDGTICLMCSYVDESSNTMAHEIGHAMNLYHTFQDACYAESDCSTEGDRICDTHQHGVSECGGATGCPGTSGTLAAAQGNYMSYCGSTSLFTADQKTRSTTALTGDRASFLASNGNLSLVPPSGATVDFYTQATAPCLNSTITFYDDSFCVPNTYSTNTGWPSHTFSWTFDNGVDTPYTSSDQNPTITFTNAGAYDVTLEITNAQGTFTTTKSAYISVSSGVSATACLPSSFNDDGNFGCGITNVSLNSINNSTSTTIPSNTGDMFHDYTCTSTTSINESTAYDLSVTYQARPEFVQELEVWIDWDNSGAFETSNANGDNENVLSDVVAAGASETSTISITAPAIVTTGQLLRMRVISEADASPTLCGQGFIQEAEDYGLLVNPGGAPTPLNNITISAQTNSKNQNVVKWMGDDEENVLYYELESSLNGSDYFKLAKIDKQEGISSYQYIDENPAEKTYYRVTAYLTFNGKLSSKPVLVNIQKPQAISVYPNPTENKITVNGSAQKLLISNIYGQLVQDVLLKNESNLQEVDVSNLSDGVYIIRFLNGDVPIHTQKLIVN